MNRNVLINVGYIIGFHGLKGEVKIKSTSDFIDKRLKMGNKLLLVKDNDSIEVSIKSSRLHKELYIVSFENYHSLNDVEKLKGYSLKVSKDNLFELEEDEYYHFELVGLDVITFDNVNLGKIKRIWDIGANDVFIIDNKGKEILIPYTSNIVDKVDLANNCIKLFEVDGLF